MKSEEKSRKDSGIDNYRNPIFEIISLRCASLQHHLEQIKKCIMPHSNSKATSSHIQPTFLPISDHGLFANLKGKCLGSDLLATVFYLGLQLELRRTINQLRLDTNSKLRRHVPKSRNLGGHLVRRCADAAGGAF